MKQFDRDYYLGRLAAEQRAARSARNPLAARTHQRMAEEYESLIVANDGAVSAGFQASPPRN